MAKIPTKTVKEILWSDSDEGEVIEDEITDTSRWSIHHELIFKYQDKFYSTNYSEGATEKQDERPFEYEGEFVECIEVKPVEVIKTVYRPV